MKAYSIYHGMDGDLKKPAGVAIFGDDNRLERLDGDGTHELFGEVLGFGRPPTPEGFVSRFKNWMLVEEKDL